MSEQENEHGIWAGVRDRVAVLRERLENGNGPADGVFGARWHGFRLAEPLGEAQVAELEGRIGVGLPAEYRGFLREVAAGGAGPACGLFPLRKVDGRWRWEGDGGELANLTRLAEPFPRRGPDPDAVRELLARRPEEEEYEDIAEFDDLMEEWDERWIDLMWNEDRTVGAIVVCHLGCARRQWLVLSGPERGTIWDDDRVDEDGTDLSPLLDAEGRPVTFASWYLDWLAGAEQAVLAAPAAP